MPMTASYPTTTVKADAAIATAELAYIDRQFGASTGNAVDHPLAATTAGGGGKSAAVTAFLSSFYSSNTNGGRGDPRKPLKTALAGANHHAVVAAHIEQANTGGMLGRRADAPLTTITTKGTQQRIVETALIEADALPPEMMARAVEVAAFLVKYYGSEGANETAQIQPLGRPLDTITVKARFAVVTVTIDATTYVIVDIGLRMLKPRELARAQGFPDDYILDPIVPKVKHGKLVHQPLTIAEQISAIGNSVCPPVARALVAANQPGIVQAEAVAA
jgi:DNA (cytosine-5)-methyltransferase 1